MIFRMKSHNMDNVNEMSNIIKIMTSTQNGNIRLIFFSDHTVLSILCGCDVWPNLVCCVAETVKGRHEVTEMMADRYKVSINRLKMKFEACPIGKLTGFRSNQFRFVCFTTHICVYSVHSKGIANKKW